MSAATFDCRSAAFKKLFADWLAIRVAALRYPKDEPGDDTSEFDAIAEREMDLSRAIIAHPAPSPRALVDKFEVAQFCADHDAEDASVIVAALKTDVERLFR